ncbi:hypothetical protein QQX98_012280 [Neonectria punicea]|uniref:Uncharacterized protein n=1 Tax=Neonectria punicea TaxID=979145 RepID=A0ABR1GJD9_9HYPO
MAENFIDFGPTPALKLIGNESNPQKGPISASQQGLLNLRDHLFGKVLLGCQFGNFGEDVSLDTMRNFRVGGV